MMAEALVAIFAGTGFWVSGFLCGWVKWGSKLAEQRAATRARGAAAMLDDHPGAEEV